MILGIGIDLVELKRIAELMSDRFIERVLSESEQKLYHNIAAEQTKLSFVGGRFAAKEALFKAFSKGDGTANYIDFSVLNDEYGAPYVVSKHIESNHRVLISISHTDAYAMAYVMIEKL
jgi:holo-[acyl-carrier protein] synthase